MGKEAPVSITVAYDCTHSNLGHVPAGQLAGYTTGSGGIAWTAADWAAHPGAVRIDQDYAALDGTADVLDVEAGAATVADCPGWVKRARAAYASSARPGQRRPAIYVNQSNKSAVVNALISGGVTSGVGLWLANWSISEAVSAADVAAASGPFPLIGIQFTDAGGTYDTDVFSSSWLGAQSGVAGSTVLEGSSGPAVLALQKALNALGASLGPDGLFGAGTLAALLRFQAAAKLTADGVAGPATWAALAPPMPVPVPVPMPVPVPVVPVLPAPVPEFGVCGAGGGHDVNSSWSYWLTSVSAGPGGQPGWKWCSKCRCLVH